MPGIIWIAVIGLIAGIIARFLLPGPNNPQGFLVTMVIGIVGAFVATWLGQSIGWYRHDQGAGLIGATLGALVFPSFWSRLVVQRTVNAQGVPPSNRFPPPTWPSMSLPMALLALLTGSQIARRA